jgi:DNA-binding NarL/FixJ family response regulator
MPRVVALVDDLFFVSKMLETARHVGVEFRAAATADALLQSLRETPAQLVIVDLNARQGGVAALEQLRAAGNTAPVVAFLSHLQAELAAQARAAGCGKVLPRSQFTQELASIFTAAKP